MELINNLTYNNNLISKIQYNNNLLQEFNYNNYKLLFNQDFDLNVLYYGSNEEIDYKNAYTSSENFICNGMQGNHAFLLKSSCNPYDIEISNTDLYFVPIDNWGLLGLKYNYNQWDGGTSVTRERIINFTYNNKTIIGYFYSIIDENNSILLEGGFPEKVIKIPSKGSSGSLKLYFYPRCFDDSLFRKPNINIRTFSQYSVYEDFKNMPTLDLNIISSYDLINEDGLTATFNYTISPNNSNEFKYATLFPEGLRIHFIQEYYSNNRIYFGYNYFVKYLSKNNFVQDNIHQIIFQSSYEYLFHTSGSIDLQSSINLDYGKKINKSWYLLIPQDLEGRFNIATSGEGNVGSEYTTNDPNIIFPIKWNDIIYKLIFGISSTIIYQFTKK